MRNRLFRTLSAALIALPLVALGAGAQDKPLSTSRTAAAQGTPVARLAPRPGLQLAPYTAPGGEPEASPYQSPGSPVYPQCPPVIIAPAPTPTPLASPTVE